MTASYERPSIPSHRPRTPSPGPSRRGYDSYVPHRSENPPYRNTYRPNIYRPEPPSYHPRSPSPDMRGSNSYRGSSWRPSDRRTMSSSPILRRFEPSDSWRHGHGHGEYATRDYASQTDRYNFSRPVTDLAPDRSPRLERPLAGVPDRHAHPFFKRETRLPERRPFMDSYRPQYDDERPSFTRREHPLTPTNGLVRRGSESALTVRPTDPDFSYVPMKPSLTATALTSPISIIHGISEPLRSSPSPSGTPIQVASRPASRSSIASTDVSDRKSPGAASIPQPLTAQLLSNVLEKPQAAIDALTKENRRTDQNYGMKPVQTSVVPQPPMHSVEPESIVNTTSTVKESVKDVSQTGTTAPQAEDSGLEGEPLETVPVAINASERTDQSSPLPLEPQAALKSPILVDEPYASLPSINKIEHESPVERTPSINEVESTEIPPTTHSPSASPGPSYDIRADHFAHSTLPRPEDIPPLSLAQTMREALNITVMTRLLRDHQSREARVNPVLVTNQAIAPPLEVHPASTPGSLIDKMCTGLAHDMRLEAASNMRPQLVKYFENRQSTIDKKITELREEHSILQERWVAHCDALNEQQRTLASEQENQPPMRTTRRSMAITDAVRSDFEMEQILASLGNDEATDPNHLSIRNLAKIPDMISAVNGKVDAVFDDLNYRVDNPAEHYAPDSGLIEWGDEEKKIFMEKFGAHPKQFGVIAEFLPNKTAAQCVAYYYLNKKMFIDFRKVVSQYAPNKRRRRGMGRKKGNGLLADIAMHDLEVHRGSGSISASRAARGRRSINAISAVKPPQPSRRNPVPVEETSTSTPTPEPESRSRKRRAVSGTPIPINPSPMSIPPLASTSLRISTSSVLEHNVAFIQPVFQTTPLEILPAQEEGAEQSRPAKRARRTRKIKSAVLVAEEPASPPLPPLLPSAEIQEKERDGPSIAQWTDDDTDHFIALFAQYGADFKQIAALMPSKTIGQVTDYFMTHQRSLALQSASRPPQPTLLPDNHGLHWITTRLETFVKDPSPPPAALMTTMKTLSVPSLSGHGSPREAFPKLPASSPMQHTNYTNDREHQIPSWSSPLPTRLSQPLGHSMPSKNPVPERRFISGERNHNPYNAGVSRQYSLAHRNPLPRDPSHGFASPKFQGGHPNRRSPTGPHLVSSPKQSFRTSSSDYRRPSRPRATSRNSTSPSSRPTATGLSYISSPISMPGSTSSAPTVNHSPVMASPRIPLHRSPPMYNSYPLPPLHRGSDPREHPPQYTRLGPLHSPTRQRPMTGWTQPNSHHSQDGQYRPRAPYDNRRRSSISEVDSRDEERRREDYAEFFPGSNESRPHYGRGWHPSSPSNNTAAWTIEPYHQPGWQ